MSLDLVVENAYILCHALLKVRSLLKAERLRPMVVTVGGDENRLTSRRAIAVQVRRCLAEIPSGLERSADIGIVGVHRGISNVNFSKGDTPTRSISCQYLPLNVKSKTNVT